MPDQATAEDPLPSGSGPLRAGAMSDGEAEEEQRLRPWVILGAEAGDLPSAGMDFLLNLREPPRVSSLAVSPRISTSSENPMAYVVAVDASGYFLLYATQGRAAPAYFVCDPHTTTASRLPNPAGDRPLLMGFKSVGFVSYRGGSGGQTRYMVTDLQLADGTGSATLLRHLVGSEEWKTDEVSYSSDWSQRHPVQWSSSSVVSSDGKVFWIDQSIGVITCDVLLDDPVLRYVPLPLEGCDMTDRSADLAKRHRWVGVCDGKLTCLRMDGIAGQPSFNLWTLTDDLSWNHRYQARFRDIWHSKALKKIKRRIQDMTVALVHPRNSHIIYFTLGSKMYMADLGAAKCKFSGVEEEMARAFTLFSAWELPEALIRGLNSSVSNHGSRRSVGNLCWQGVNIGQIMASKAGVRVSSVGSNLLYLNQECTEAKSYFKHISEYETSGHGYAASAADMSTKASKRISKILGGAGSILSFGGNTLSSVGHSMQQLHPNAQTGASARSSITEVITIESIQHAEDAIQQWVDSKQKFIAEVPCHMETKLAEEIMMLFKEAGALVLVENSTILRDKASRVLDDASEWELM